MAKGFVVGYADVVERCGDRAGAYAEFAEALGLSAALHSETFHVDGTRLRISLLREGIAEEPIPVDVTVTPADRVTLTLPMIVATMQVLAIMAEGVLGTAVAQGGTGTEESLLTRRSLESCRRSLRDALGDSYPLLLDIGAGPEICAEFDDGRHVPAPDGASAHA